jgi:hypothetical protein
MASSCALRSPDMLGAIYPSQIMSEKTKFSERDILQFDVLIKQGLRLTNIFMNLQDVHDRQKVIALAERLLNEQNAS